MEFFVGTMLQLKLLVVLGFFLSAAAFENNSYEIEPRMVQGYDAILGQFPYYAFLRILKRQKQNLCGGSLISNEWILTAGHCITNAIAIEVHLGGLSTLDYDNDGHKTINIRPSSISTSVYVHPKYNAAFYVK